MSLWLVLIIAFGVTLGMLAIVLTLMYFFGTDPFTKEKWYKSGRY